MSPNRFLRPAIIALVLLFASTTSRAENITVFFDQNTPQYVFAAGDIRSALELQKHTVEFRELSSLDKAPKSNRIVITSASDKRVVSAMTAQGAAGLPGLKAQAYALRTSDKKGKTYWVIGGDVNGAMYGGLQIAEYINFSGFGPAYNEEDSPHLTNRGIKFNIPLDKDSPTYYYGHHGTAHKLAIKDVWELSFWETWFDEMARHRYNVLSLWSPHPFTSMLNMEDEYPGIAIHGVVGFDEAGKDLQVNTWSIDRKIEFWREVMKYGRQRGFDIYFCNWNVFLSTAEGKHGLTYSTENPLTKEYLRKCVIKFFETYPDLKGFGITVGERMGKLDTTQREEWAWDSFGKGVMEYALRNPDREIVFVHRQHDGDIDHILKYFAHLNDLPNVRFDLSCKYSEAHAHSTLTPSRWHRTGMSKGLEKHGIMAWLTIRNDDFFFLHWAEPQFVREYIQGFPKVDTYVNAFYIGSDGWVFAKDFTSRNPFYEDRDALSIQRTWYMQKLWGRLSYNPSLSDEFFKKHLALRFPEVRVDKLFEAWSSASGAIRRANEQVTGKWQFDQDFWAEMWTGDNWKDNGRHFSIEETQAATPFAGSPLATLKDTALGTIGGKVSAWDNIETIDKLSTNALAILKTLDAGANTELRLTLQDLTAQAYLGLYNAYKYRTVIHDIRKEGDKARQAMGMAYCYWRKYTDIMSELYKPVEMQRNKSFASWHDYDEAVLLEYHKLGGIGIPVCKDK
jgi:hypothetical protein